MSRWSEALKKTGDFLIVHDNDVKAVSRLVHNFMRTAYGPDAVYATRTIPGGTFIAAAYIPQGAREAYEKRKDATRLKRQMNIADLNNDRWGEFPVANVQDDDEDPLEKYDGNFEVDIDDEDDD